MTIPRGICVFAFYFLSLPVLLSAFREPNGLTCNDHPAFHSSLKPVLVRSWYIYSGNFPQQVAYFPNFKNATFAPVSDRTSTKYKDLDYFFTGDQVENPSYRMYFQRRAVVHMMVPVSNENANFSKSVSLPGWTSEGWVRRVAGSSTLVYGIHQRKKFPISQFWYMFSKKSTKRNGDHYADLPQNIYVKKNMKNINVEGNFDLLIAERDGSASQPVGDFKGRTIKPNTRCPDDLHNTWITTDRDDPDTAGMKFNTWHPTWDPCYWCAYDHDHGSSPYHIFGYAPKYSYVAHKNFMEPESHTGFKGFVYLREGLFVYYSIHAQTSSMRRVTARNHTLQLVIANATTKEILVNVAHKGDFGWNSVRLDKFSQFRALTAADEALERDQKAAGAPRRFRSIPVLDSRNGTFNARKPVILGQYEEWQTVPICAHPAKKENTKDVIRVSFKEPITGIKAFEKPDSRVNLGRCITRIHPRRQVCDETQSDSFVYHNNLMRAIFMLNVKVSDTLCPGRKKGVFYTDPYGVATFSSPGPNRLRQYIKPGFTTVLKGRFEPVDPWVGLHLEYGRGHFLDHCYGIDPKIN